MNLFFEIIFQPEKIEKSITFFKYSWSRRIVLKRFQNDPESLQLWRNTFWQKISSLYPFKKTMLYCPGTGGLLQLEITVCKAVTPTAKVATSKPRITSPRPNSDRFSIRTVPIPLPRERWHKYRSVINTITSFSCRVDIWVWKSPPLQWGSQPYTLY